MGTIVKLERIPKSPIEDDCQTRKDSLISPWGRLSNKKGFLNRPLRMIVKLERIPKYSHGDDCQTRKDS